MDSTRINKYTQGALRTLLVCLVSGATMPLAWGQSAPAPAPAPAAPGPSPIFAQCAQENNITIPAPGSGDRLSIASRQTIHKCVRTAAKAQFQTCAQQSNITLPAKGSGQRLSKEQRQEIKQCMVAAGFPKFHRRHRRHPGNGENEGSSQQSS